jgi:hypothetical protein
VDSTGAAVNGKHNLTFNIYNNEAANGTALYTENQLDISVEKGHFTVYLGSGPGTNLNLNLFRDNPALWLQVTIDSTEKLLPLFRLATVPYAAYAQQCVDSQTLAGKGADQYAPVSDGLTAFGASCAGDGDVPQWSSTLKRWSCGKISTDTTFTANDPVNAVASAGFMKDTDVAAKARAVCYDDTDADGSIPAKKVNLAEYATNSTVDGKLQNYATQTSINSSVTNAVNNAVSSAGYAKSSDLINGYYNKTEVDSKIATGTAQSVPWSSITGRPAGLDDGDQDTVYTNSQAVTAMGSKGSSNPLNHDRYTDSEARTAVASQGYLTASNNFAGSATTSTYEYQSGDGTPQYIARWVRHQGTANPPCDDSHRGMLTLMSYAGGNIHDRLCVCLAWWNVPYWYCLLPN